MHGADEDPGRGGRQGRRGDERSRIRELFTVTVSLETVVRVTLFVSQPETSCAVVTTTVKLIG